jgi:hypothetical protein
MACRLTTLLDALSSSQFRIVVLLTLGLETSHIADLLDTSEHAVLLSLTDSLRRTGCRDARDLCERALHECDHELYDEMRLKMEMAPLQDAAQRILARSGAQLRLAQLN